MGKEKKPLESAEELNKKGNGFYDKKEYHKAIEFYEKAIKADAAYVWAYYNLGLAHKNLGDYEKARENMEKAIQLDPQYTDAINQLGNLYYDQREYEEAEKCYSRVQALNPTLHYVYYNLMLIEKERKNREKVFELLQKSLELKPDYSLALNEMGNYYYDDSEYDKARDYYQKALAADPQNKYALYNMGLIAELDSDNETARHFYEKSLTVDPNYELPLTALRKIKDKMKDLGELKDNQGASAGKTDAGGESPESFIKKIGRNLNELAKAGRLNEVIGRDREIETILEILHKRFKNNPLIIGHPGTGKTAIVEGIAKRIAEGKVPENFKKKEIIEINTGFLIAGTKYRGDFEIKIKKILDDARNNPDIILFIDELHTIIGAGRVEDSNLDIAQMLKPALQNGDITCIGATTTGEYRRYIESDPALERRFYPVMIDELSPEATCEILCNTLPKANEYYITEITKDNIDEIVRLCSRHLKKRYFPDKAIDIFEKLASRCSLKGRRTISSEDIRQMIAETAGIQFVEDDEDEISKLAHLEESLKKEIFGQDSAIDAVCNILRITKRRLDLRPERPDGVFLLTGPTGVGKTFLAKSLTRQLYGSEKYLIQLDMSEYSEPFSVSKLIGAPPGYVGFETATPLSAVIEENPTSILLLDEIEKADQSVIRLFLQVFEEGRITDTKGRKIYFSDITIIMTSNIMTRQNLPLGFFQMEGGRNNSDRVVEELSRHFPREFLNRIDEIILFRSLGREDVRNILVSNIITAAEERFSREGVLLHFSDTLIEHIIAEGYSSEQGARNLLRTFEKMILAPLVKHLYAGGGKNADIRLDWKGGVLDISAS